MLNYIAYCFDQKDGSFRNEMYEDYKANRSSTPDDLKEQIQPIKDLVVAMGFPLICMEGVEADESRMVARGIGLSGQVVSGRKEVDEVLN